VHSEGSDPRPYPGLADRAAIVAIGDSGVAFTTVGGTDQLPSDVAVPLTGGRAKGPALELPSLNGDQPLLELVPAAGVVDPLDLQITAGQSTLDNATAVVNLTVSTGGELLESFSDLTMDPDDLRYLPDVLQESAFVRGIDLFVRDHALSFPRAVSRPQALEKGEPPSPDDYQEALERLEGAEEVDLVIASVNDQLTDERIRTVHQSVVAHCTKMADVARNRIGIGSVTETEAKTPAACLDHADDVRSDHFVLAAPARMEGALAGLLGRQDYFQSPTFKTIAAPGAPPGTYTDAQLTQLLDGNVLVINERRKLGIIVVKGILTSGRDINVQRVANKAVRDVKAIADVYIGLLNNEGARNALRQQIVALLLQMERDGAIVPSVDGTDPAFKVDVYSTQADFANGIVRIDIATRPVREIKFIYGTILVQN
jgi:hypothetical protein